MGKVAKPQKTKDISVKKLLHAKKHAVGKSVPKVSFKRLVMLQRRLNSLLAEQSLWEEKNKELLDNYKAEKMLSASLRKESFHWQRLYHESTLKVNTYKVKQPEMTQDISSCMREIDKIYPHLLAFSESVTGIKLIMSKMLASQPSSEYEYLPRQFQGSGRINETFNKSTEMPKKNPVRPMVKGFLITKPKIMLERLMLPLRQDPEPAINDNVSAIEVNNQLTPIPEENDHEEDVRMEHISVRPKRKLGKSSWRLRRQETIAKERERERKIKPPASATYDGDSSDTESNKAALIDMEPVVRIKDVTRLLQNSSLLKVDSSRNGDSNGLGSDRQSDTDNRHLPISKVKRTTEDPLEGSSWMFNNNHNLRTSYGPPVLHGRSALFKSDSSDDYEDENIVVQNNISDLSSMDTLDMKNQTYTKMNNNRFTVGTSNDTPTAEPDSTNNIDVQHSNNSSFTDFSENKINIKPFHKSGSFSSNTSVENSLSLEMPSEPRLSNNIYMNSAVKPVSEVGSSKDSISVQSPIDKRGSSFCNNCGPAQTPPECIGKRIRKQKTHLYPGEEDFSPQVKPTSHKSSTGKKTGKDSTSRKIKKRSSAEDPTLKEVDGVATKARKKKSKGGKIIGRVTISKKSSVKVCDTSGISSISGSLSDIVSDNRDSNRPRRTKSQVNYKEISMNVKQRRP
uniref:Uncharacterized protein n=2 Tax=Graphocephala atropunctata TaxID=36148 RepID=A0A1B6L601_9HEMI